MDVNRLLLFHGVVRAGSFSGAARELNISRQAVSEQIARLEAELDVRLLDRTTRTLHPTDAGRRLFERSREVFEVIREAEAELAGMQGRPAGRLRVSVPGAFGRLFLAPVAARLLRSHPDLSIQAHLTDRRVNLVEEGFDAAVRIGDLDDSSLVRRKLGAERLVYVGSAAFIRERGVPAPAQLRNYPVVGFREDETWTIDGRAIPVGPTLVVDDLQAVAAAVLEGCGLARLPWFVVAEPLSDGRLERVFESEPSPTRDLWVVYPSRRLVPAKTRCFVEALADHVQERFGRSSS